MLAGIMVKRIITMTSIVGIILGSLVAPALWGQSAELVQRTGAQGYWIDTATNLMWASKDSDKEYSWKKAMKYCGAFRLAGFSDWRLARLEELQGVFDKHANSPGLDGAKEYHNVSPTTYHIRGGIFLRPYQWTSTEIAGHTRFLNGYAWRFDFGPGDAFDGDEKSFRHRALCVRTPADQQTTSANGATTYQPRAKP